MGAIRLDSSNSIGLTIRAPDGSCCRLLAPLERGFWLGRDPACEICLPSSEVSRKHAFVALNAEGLSLFDQSSNGTLVGNELVRGEPYLLTGPWQPLRVGPYVLDFEALPDSPRPESDPPPPSGHRPCAPKADAGQPPPASRGRLSLPAAERRQLLSQLLDEIELPNVGTWVGPHDALRASVLEILDRLLRQCLESATDETARRQLAEELADEALGLGPLEPLLADPRVSEILVVGPSTIYVERDGKLEKTAHCFTDDDAVRATIERIIAPLGRRIDESSPVADGRLPDGSRVHAVLPPLSLVGPCITIRKFPQERLDLRGLIERGCLSHAMTRFLVACVRARKNILVSGGTGSGKTTLLNCLSAAIPSSERIITIEDAAELQLAQPHVVSLESRPPNLDNRGAFPIRQLLYSALRMRPDRIVVGECRGGEALDMLQAMNTGHDGSMTTLHASTPSGVLLRLETLSLMAGAELPLSAIRQQVASSIDLVVQLNRSSDGFRRVTSIHEVLPLSQDGELELRELFGYDPHEEHGYYASGFLPNFAGELTDCEF